MLRRHPEPFCGRAVRHRNPQPHCLRRRRHGSGAVVPLCRTGRGSARCSLRPMAALAAQALTWPWCLKEALGSGMVVRCWRRRWCGGPGGTGLAGSAAQKERICQHHRRQHRGDQRARRTPARALCPQPRDDPRCAQWRNAGCSPRVQKAVVVHGDQAQMLLVSARARRARWIMKAGVSLSPYCRCRTPHTPWHGPHRRWPRGRSHAAERAGGRGRAAGRGRAGLCHAGARRRAGH